MPTPDRMQLAAEVSPVTVLVRGVLEWMFPDESLEALYAQAPRCWTRALTIRDRTQTPLAVKVVLALVG